MCSTKKNGKMMKYASGNVSLMFAIESSLSLKSSSSMEFLPFPCEEDDFAALELLSMSKISHYKFMNTVLGGGVPYDIVQDSNSTLVL